MNLILSSVILSVLTIANAPDRFQEEPEQVSIATTGRIVKIDAKNNRLKVRVSEGQALTVRNVSQNLTQVMQNLKQRIGVTLPGGITISLPGRNGKTPTKSPDEAVARDVDEYTVILTRDTVFQDGAETLRLEDFKTGETISIHGLVTGDTITAARIAKWF
jgi:hypothetical protein